MGEALSEESSSSLPTNDCDNRCDRRHEHLFLVWGSDNLGDAQAALWSPTWFWITRWPSPRMRSQTLVVVGVGVLEGREERRQEMATRNDCDVRLQTAWRAFDSDALSRPATTTANALAWPHANPRMYCLDLQEWKGQEAVTTRLSRVL